MHRVTWNLCVFLCVFVWGFGAPLCVLLPCCAGNRGRSRVTLVVKYLSYSISHEIGVRGSNLIFVLFLDWLARSCGGLAVDCLTMYGRPKWSTSLRCIHPCHSLHGYSSHYSFIFSHSLLRVGGTGTINASSSLVYFCFSWILCFGVVHLYPSCFPAVQETEIGVEWQWR